MIASPLYRWQASIAGLLLTAAVAGCQWSTGSQAPATINTLGGPVLAVTPQIDRDPDLTADDDEDELDDLEDDERQRADQLYQR